MTDKEFQSTDHLKEYMTVLAKRLIEDYSIEELPIEFKGIEKSRLAYLIAAQAVPILRKIEDDAIRAAIESVAGLIRYAKKSSTK